MNANIKQLLKKAKESALLAVEIYNKPRTAFRSGGYIVFMAIAWISLFQAIFERNKIKYFYKKNNGRYYDRIDGDKKSWDLSKSIEEYYKGQNNPVKENLKFFITLRNKIEHRFLPALDDNIFGECQAMLINFEKLIVDEFGTEHAINENLVFSLQFSSIIHDEQQKALINKQSKEYKNIMEFIETYRSGLDYDIKNNLNYSFKVFLIPKVGLHEKSSNVALEFIKYDPNKPEDLEQYKKFLVAIKEKQTLMIGFRAGQVCEKVRVALRNEMPSDWKFTPSQHHAKCWKYYKIRPSKNSSEPERTKKEFCFYNYAFNQYEYTEEWVQLLIKNLKNKTIYNQIMKIK